MPGLAQVGGDTLQIEVNLMPGKGEFLLTGQLGDVIKECPNRYQLYSLRGRKYGIKPEFFQKHDLHIHIPEGAVRKQRLPSITMATAMLLRLPIPR